MFFLILGLAPLISAEGVSSGSSSPRRLFREFPRFALLTGCCNAIRNKKNFKQRAGDVLKPANASAPKEDATLVTAGAARGQAGGTSWTEATPVDDDMGAIDALERSLTCPVCAILFVFPVTVRGEGIFSRFLLLSVLSFAPRVSVAVATSAGSLTPQFTLSHPTPPHHHHHHKQLPCQHSMCLECLERWVQSSSTTAWKDGDGDSGVPCPCCRHPFSPVLVEAPSACAILARAVAIAKTRDKNWRSSKLARDLGVEILCKICMNTGGSTASFTSKCGCSMCASCLVKEIEIAGQAVEIAAERAKAAGRSLRIKIPTRICPSCKKDAALVLVGENVTNTAVTEVVETLLGKKRAPIAGADDAEAPGGAPSVANETADARAAISRHQARPAQVTEAKASEALQDLRATFPETSTEVMQCILLDAIEGHGGSVRHALVEVKKTLQAQQPRRAEMRREAARADEDGRPLSAARAITQDSAFPPGCRHRLTMHSPNDASEFEVHDAERATTKVKNSGERAEAASTRSAIDRRRASAKVTTLQHTSNDGCSSSLTPRSPLPLKQISRPLVAHPSTLVRSSRVVRVEVARSDGQFLMQAWARVSWPINTLVPFTFSFCIFV